MFLFEWDEHKNRSNQRKHGLSFQQAVAIFHDPYALANVDRMVEGEQRWQTLGMRKTDLLLVVHTTQEENEWDEVIRIISARRATPEERQIYEAENRKVHI